MIKIAIFVEGQTELIFIRSILSHIIDPSKFSFRCFKLHAESLKDFPYSYENPKAEVHFQIINVGNDEKVMAAIKDREGNLIEKGF